MTKMTTKASVAFLAGELKQAATMIRTAAEKLGQASNMSDVEDIVADMLDYADTLDSPKAANTKRPSGNRHVLPNGKVIVGERCTCGLRKDQHGGIHGHGAAPGCGKFTWKAFIFEDGSEGIC